ncbi:MAG: hypothetical protein K9L66_04095 [Spirochaetaceae bacterium]|nr:hypothetical protein [Spirochaetaceae bacterium]MCF7948370.1 hypothetical protein [Spirochaetia bacterium]MCF7950835.1 hypothetical protein [Spirochaetaceae bacterium]
MRSGFTTNKRFFADAGVPRGTLRFYSFMVMVLLLFFWSSPLLLIAEEGGGSTSGTSSKVEGILEEHGYSESDIQGVLNVFLGAQNKGVPGDMLVPRVQEGVAKGVPAPRLVGALKRDIDYLMNARRLFAEAEAEGVFLSRESQWKRAANMLAAGFGSDELGRLIQICREDPDKFRPISLLYASLSTWGLSKEDGLSVAEALVSSAIPSEEYEGILDLYRAARRERIRPEELTERIAARAGSSESVEELERVILR